MGEAKNIYFTCLKSVLKFLFPIFKRTVKMVNAPKTRRTFCAAAKCRKHTLHKVTQWRSDQAYLQKEGQDHQKDRPQIGVHRLQEKRSSDHQTMQAFRARRREEEEGTNAPILRSEEKKKKKEVHSKLSFVLFLKKKCFGNWRVEERSHFHRLSKTLMLSTLF